MSEITTISIFHFKSWKQKFFALKSMRTLLPNIVNGEGILFIKHMGSGSQNGFSVWPDFTQYVLMIVWASEDKASTFFEQSSSYLNYKAISNQSQTIFLKNTMAHGLWNNQMPFSKVLEHNDNLPVAVITRATIKWKDMIRFWRDVPQVSNSIPSQNGPLFAVGVGELPFRYQATFSVWKNSTDMKAYAYQNHYHKNMVSKTKKTGWYKEELFARFWPYKSEGDQLIPIK
ncbi:MAG: DUF3291 domain-containing protein [Saprospiraceae bacterium]|nr:DUF3291 domain-containing protein [Saprospiraceae bacterium]